MSIAISFFLTALYWNAQALLVQYARKRGERAAREASNIPCSVRTLCPCWQTTVSASLMFCVDDVTDADFLARIEVLTAVWISIAFECMQ